MKILLTGASGFLGRVCLTRLRAEGHLVIGADRTGAVDLKGDLADRTFTSTLPDCDAVVHAAAVQYVSTDLPLIRRNGYFQRNNVVATSNLCSRYRGHETHFVQIGTSMMYRHSGLPVYKVTSPMEGQGMYSRSKLAAQEHVANLPNPKATILPCIIGGEGREGLFRGFVNMMARYRLVLIPGRGEHPVHMVHVHDVASLVSLVVRKRARGTFNAAAPNPLSIQAWVDEIEEELGLSSVRRICLPLEPVHLLSALSGYRLLAREQILMLSHAHVLSTEESEALGWKPQYTNSHIVRDIAKYLSATRRVH